jgi:hypothetical protein
MKRLGWIDVLFLALVAFIIGLCLHEAFGIYL